MSQTTESQAKGRLQSLRTAMSLHGLDWYLVPSSDEHLNEYLPPWRCRREWMSGFTGSAGDLLVGRTAAWMYVDGRYHLQADIELQGTGITPMKVGQKDAKPLSKHLVELAKQQPGMVVGIDPMVVPLATAKQLREILEPCGAKLAEIEGNLVDPLWVDRPAPPRTLLVALPEKWTGCRSTEKIEMVRKDLAEKDASAITVVKLDQIAWLFNLRSKDDVPYNPVFESFLYLDSKSVHLFLHGASERLPSGFGSSIPGLRVHAYEDFAAFLNQPRNDSILIDPSATTRGVVSSLEASGARIVQAPSPIEERKAVKSTAEQEAIQRANLRASVAKTRALLWLRRQISTGRRVTERVFARHLEKLYSEQPGYFDLSFTTISATGPNGAIIHYGKCDETPLENGHLFLIDSGAHIEGGTTDDTRTVAVGACDDEARRVYTAVLKGHVRAALQHIPEGVPGTALDALARSPLWNEGLNYDHGTGHGVGAFLNVHEGPFAISERERKPYAVHPLTENIVSSIEPGYYRPGWGGVRLENLYLYKACEKGAGAAEKNGRKWLRLEPLTWIPFDHDLIDEDMLDRAEKSWLREYHQQCIERLAPFLSDEEKSELHAWIGEN